MTQVIENIGGEYRNRTGVHGFAIRCVTTPPTRHPWCSEGVLQNDGINGLNLCKVQAPFCVLFGPSNLDDVSAAWRGEIVVWFWGAQSCHILRKTQGLPLLRACSCGMRTQHESEHMRN